MVDCTLAPYGVKVKVKGATDNRSVGEVIICLYEAVESVGGYTTEFATHVRCDDRPTVTFPDA